MASDVVEMLGVIGIHMKTDRTETDPKECMTSICL